MAFPNSTPSSFAIVNGSPSHSSTLTRSLVVFSKLGPGGNANTYGNVVLYRQIFLQPTQELSSNPLVADLDKLDLQLYRQDPSTRYRGAE